MTSWVYSKVAGSNEPATYSLRITMQYAAGVIRAWRGASLSTPIHQFGGNGGERQSCHPRSAPR